MIVIYIDIPQIVQPLPDSSEPKNIIKYENGTSPKEVRLTYWYMEAFRRDG
jgi:hypothetical protein